MLAICFEIAGALVSINNAICSLCQPHGLLVGSDLQPDGVVRLVKNDFASIRLVFHNRVLLFANIGSISISTIMDVQRKKGKIKLIYRHMK